MKNCHLLRHKIATLTFLSLMALEASTGWATTIQGNLEVKAKSGSDTANGNLIVEGITTLKGNTTLGSRASETITIGGSIKAESSLTVEGAIKIQSVDSTANGVVTNIDEHGNNDKIPTTLAVKNYIDSVTNSLYLPAEYFFKIAVRNPNLSLWSLTNKEYEYNVSKRIGPNKRLIATVDLQQPEDEDSGERINGELILSKVNCKDYNLADRVDPEHYAFNASGSQRQLIALSYVNTGDIPQTLYICGFFWGNTENTNDEYEFDYAHIAIHSLES